MRSIKRRARWAKVLTFLLFFLLVLSYFANAQFGDYANVRAVRLINGTEALAGVRNGTIYYDLNLNVFRFRQANAWLTLGGGGGSGISDGNKGDITVSGTGANWFINTGAVTFAKFQTIGTGSLLGRTTAGTGLVESLTGTQVNTLLPVFSSTLKGLVPQSGGGTTNFLRADGTWADPGTGAGGGTTETASNGLYKTGSDIRQGGGVIENTSITFPNGNAYELRYGSGATSEGFFRGSYGFGYGGWHIAAGDYLTRAGAFHDLWVDVGSGLNYNSKTSTGQTYNVSINATEGLVITDNRAVKKGARYATTGYDTDPLSLITRGTVEQLIAAAGSSNGLADGDKGNITVTNNGATWTVDSDVITYAKIQNVTGLRFLGRSSSTTGDPQEITGTTATGMLDNFTSTTRGIVPASGGGTANFLRADGSWAAPPTGGSTPGVFTSTVNGLVPASGGGTGKYLRSDATWATMPVFADATYNPTVITSSGATSVTLTTAQYLRVGNSVTVSGAIWLDPNFASTGELVATVSLPVASNFTNAVQLGGTFAHWPEGNEVGTCSSDPVNNAAAFTINLSSEFDQNIYYYNYTYRIF